MDSPKARPICFLNDIVFERILDRRLKEFMNILPRLRAPSQAFVSGTGFGKVCLPCIPGG